MTMIVGISSVYRGYIVGISLVYGRARKTKQSIGKRRGMEWGPADVNVSIKRERRPQEPFTLFLLFPLMWPHDIHSIPSSLWSRSHFLSLSLSSEKSLKDCYFLGWNLLLLILQSEKLDQEERWEQPHRHIACSFLLLVSVLFTCTLCVYILRVHSARSEWREKCFHEFLPHFVWWAFRQQFV